MSTLARARAKVRFIEVDMAGRAAAQATRKATPAIRRVPSASAGPSRPVGLRALLVPVDLTPGSDRVLARVPRLPLADRARITLLHVVPGSLPVGDQRRAARDATKALAEEGRHLRAQIPGKIDVEVRVEVGSAPKEIAACAAAGDVDLVVMGRGGGRALKDSFLGSTAERVVRHAQRPVLVVRLPARHDYGRPALALDLDPVAVDVVRTMLAVLPPPRPPVEVIHAYDYPYQGMIYPSLSEDDVEDWREELRANATRDLRKCLAAAVAAAEVAPEDEPMWHLHVRQGSPRIVVEKATKRTDPDLLVLGTRAHSGAKYVFLGTVAGDVLRAAKCDVLIVPPRAPER